MKKTERFDCNQVALEEIIIDRPNTIEGLQARKEAEL